MTNSAYYSAAAATAARNASDALDAKLATRTDNDETFVAGVHSRNPWLRKHRNLTSQMRLLRLNPDLAASLKERAASEEGTR